MAKRCDPMGQGTVGRRFGLPCWQTRLGRHWLRPAPGPRPATPRSGALSIRPSSWRASEMDTERDAAGTSLRVRGNVRQAGLDGYRTFVLMSFQAPAPDRERVVAPSARVDAKRNR